MNRILLIKDIDDAVYELQKIGVSSQGINVMAPKTLGLSIKLTDVKIGAANILKQEMLSIGGDAAVARGVVEGSIPRSDVILLGEVDKIKKLIKKLDHQTIFGLPVIKKDLELFLDQLLRKEDKSIDCRGKKILLDSTKIVGILNITPDSFSDGNEFLNPEKAVKHALQMIDEGADLIDIGGESTRPGAKKIIIEEEKKRVVPIIEEIRKKMDVPISIDTYKSEVADAAIRAGASVINDISALRFDPQMINILQKYDDVPIILMHMQGNPETMQENPFYKDTIEEILDFFKERINFCLSNGISRNRIIIDPGIGFGKRHEDNLIVLKKISEFHCFDVPVLLGASRKSFINRIYSSSPEDRLAGSLAASSLAFANKVDFVRVHDVKEQKRFLDVLKAIRNIK
ncbi:MAG TPA: dihydropteroate synthase [Candidatus Cloacimonetes bacterium]|nr:dihydropteroate synthase [Candidatus Cloacimonadota bacterium]